MWNLISKVLYKLLTIALAIPIAKLVARMTERAWTALRPGNPQHDPKRHDTQLRDAVAWAAVTAAGAAVTKLATSKSASEVWRAAIGTEPPAKTPKSAKKDRAQAQRAGLAADADATR